MKHYFTTSQVARLAHLHKNTVLGAVKRGILKAHLTPGGHYRVSRDEVLRYLNERGIPYDIEELSRIRSDHIYSGRRKNRLLIVEDNVKLATLMKQELSKQGWRVKMAHSGYDAGFLMASFRPHVLLLDIMLPDISGEDVLKNINLECKPNRTRVIVVSAYLDEEIKERLLKLGVVAFISKPFSMKRLCELVATEIRPKNRSSLSGSN